MMRHRSLNFEAGHGQISYSWLTLPEILRSFLSMTVFTYLSRSSMKRDRLSHTFRKVSILDAVSLLNTDLPKSRSTSIPWGIVMEPWGTLKTVSSAG